MHSLIAHSQHIGQAFIMKFKGDERCNQSNLYSEEALSLLRVRTNKGLEEMVKVVMKPFLTKKRQRRGCYGTVLDKEEA